MRLRAFVALALGLALAPMPAGAFSNEFRSGPLSQLEGHGLLVRMAASGTAFEGRSLELVQAQRELDFPGIAPGSLDLGPAELLRALVSGYDPGEQKKHFLRWYSGLPAWRAATRPLEQDWAEAVGYVRFELLEAYRSSTTQETSALGRALHALQDSFSTAHVERSPEGRIRGMAYYPSQAGHQLVDDRDRLRLPTGELAPEAMQAVGASRELLVGFSRWRGAPEAAFGRWVEAFTERHLGMETKPRP